MFQLLYLRSRFSCVEHILQIRLRYPFIKPILYFRAVRLSQLRYTPINVFFYDKLTFHMDLSNVSLRCLFIFLILNSKFDIAILFEVSSLLLLRVTNTSIPFYYTHLRKSFYVLFFKVHHEDVSE